MSHHFLFRWNAFQERHSSPYSPTHSDFPKYARTPVVRLILHIPCSYESCVPLLPHRVSLNCRHLETSGKATQYFFHPRAPDFYAKQTDGQIGDLIELMQIVPEKRNQISCARKGATGPQQMKQSSSLSGLQDL